MFARVSYRQSGKPLRRLPRSWTARAASQQASGESLGAELDAATYDLEYLIDDALVARQPCILAGGKKPSRLRC